MLQTNHHDVFISYARLDGRDEADQLYHALTTSGLSAWRDERSLNPFQDFSGEIEKAIENSAHVVVCLTPSIAERKDSFVRREIIYAQGCEKPITPLVFPGFPQGKVPTLINHLTWMDFSQFDYGLGNLIGRLKGDNPAYLAPAANDPFREYLQAIYKDIVAFLDSTIFSLITLHSTATPDAVHTPREAITRALPMGFKALNVKAAQQPSHEEKDFSNFAEAFDHYRGRVLLLGDPGAGKTTTLMAYAREAIARRLENPSMPLPLVAPISSWPIDDAYRRNYKGSGERPFLVPEWLGDLNPLLGESVIAQVMEKGEALLLLDGLDELGETRQIKVKVKQKDPNTGLDIEQEQDEQFDPRAEFIHAIQDYADHNPTLVTCRVVDYEAIGEKIELQGAIRLQPLDDDQMAEYLAHQPDLWTAVKADSALREMVRTPLLLSLLTFAYTGMGEAAQKLRDLSHSPSDLRDAIFKSYVERRYQHEEIRSNASLPFQLEQLYAVLGYAAVLDVNRQTDNIVVVADVAEGLGYDVSSLIKKSSRLSLGFRKPPQHHSSASPESREDIQVDHLPEAIKTPFIKFIEQSERLHLLMPREGWFRFIHLLIRDYFAFHYSAQQLLRALPDQDSIRHDAARALGLLGDLRAVPILIQALDDSSAAVRETAARSLGKLGSVNAIEPLLSKLKDVSSDVRRGASYALGQIPDERSILALGEVLNDSEMIVRRNAVQALGRIQSNSTAAHFLLAALGNRDAITRWYAAEAFKKSGAHAISLLVEKLSSDQVQMREFAARALGMARSPQAVEPLTALLGDTARANEWSLRICDVAAESLVKIGQPSLEAVQRVLSHELAVVRTFAARIIGQIASKMVTQFASEASEADMKPVALAIEPLIWLLEDEDELVRFTADQAINNVGVQLVIADRQSDDH